MSNAATVDLKGDNSDLNKALKESESSVTSFGSNVKSVLVGIGVAAAAAFAWKVGSGLFDTFIEEASDAEAAASKLEAVLKATGNQTGFTAEQLGGLADHLESVTKFNAEAVMGVEGLFASMKNIRGDQLVTATKLSLDLAEALGGDAQGAAQKLAKALNEPIRGIEMLDKSGASFTQTEKDLVASLVAAGDIMGAQDVMLEALANQYGGLAEAAGTTFSGALVIMQNRLGNVAQVIGDVLLKAFQDLQPAFESFIVFLENTIPLFGDALTVAIEFGKGLMEWMAPAFDFIVEAGVAAFTALQVAIENWRDTTALILYAWTLKVVKDFELMKYFLSVVLPETLAWFADNWRDVFTTVANFLKTVVTNMSTNIWEFVQGIKRFLQTGSADFKFTALLEGFESTIKEMPQISKRIIGETEAGLQLEVDRLGGGLKSKFEDKFAENMAAFKGLGEKTEKEALDLAHNASEVFNAEEFKQKKVKEDKEEKEKKAKEPKEKKEAKEKAEKEQQVSFEGLDSLQKRIQAAAAGAHEDPVEKAVERGNGLLGEIQDGIGVAGEFLENIAPNIGEAFGTATDFLGEKTGEIAGAIKDHLSENIAELLVSSQEKGEAQLTILRQMYDRLNGVVEEGGNIADALPGLGTFK